MFDQASNRVKIAAAVIFANWFICGALAWVVGGTALYGQIVDGQFLVRIGETAPPIAVSAGFWTFSFFYTVSTAGGTFLALALLRLFYRPRWDRDMSDVILVSLSGLLFLLVLVYSAPRFAAWAAV